MRTKKTWRAHGCHQDFRMAMSDDAEAQLNPELKKSDKRSAELDAPDVETDQKRVGMRDR